MGGRGYTSFNGRYVLLMHLTIFKRLNRLVRHLRRTIARSPVMQMRPNIFPRKLLSRTTRILDQMKSESIPPQFFPADANFDREEGIEKETNINIVAKEIRLIRPLRTLWWMLHSSHEWFSHDSHISGTTATRPTHHAYEEEEDTPAPSASWSIFWVSTLLRLRVSSS